MDMPLWLDAVIASWTQPEIDMVGVRSKLFNLIILPAANEDLKALDVYFDVLFLRLEAA